MIARLGGKRVFPIGIGTYRMGGWLTRSTANAKSDVKALKYAIGQGINVIDTAELYGGGHAEELVGEAIKGHDREKLFIISKVFIHNLSYKKTITACESSLRRLGTDYIDLYLIHWYNPLAKLHETIGAMERLIDDGKIRNMGVSNFSVDRIKEAMFYAKKHPITANQINYSVARKDPEEDIIPFCKRNNIAVIAHTPLGEGRVLKMDEVRQLARKYRKKPAQIALNYLLKNSLPIPKSSSPQHLKEIIGSVGWHLDDDDYTALAKV